MFDNEYFNLTDAKEYFERYPKTPRLKSGTISISEKIDGTNASFVVKDGTIVCVMSKKRLLSPVSDNQGFCRWVYDNAEQLVTLGDGRHNGEWVGCGICGSCKNRYKLTEKRFYLFNTFRPVESLPECCHQVPLLYVGSRLRDFNEANGGPIELEDMVMEAFHILRRNGSNLNTDIAPEGICVYDHDLRITFKKTFEYPNGKWGEK